MENLTHETATAMVNELQALAEKLSPKTWLEPWQVQSFFKETRKRMYDHMEKCPDDKLGDIFFSADDVYQLLWADLERPWDDLFELLRTQEEKLVRQALRGTDEESEIAERIAKTVREVCVNLCAPALCAAQIEESWHDLICEVENQAGDGWLMEGDTSRLVDAANRFRDFTQEWRDRFDEVEWPKCIELSEDINKL